MKIFELLKVCDVGNADLLDTNYLAITQCTMQIGELIVDFRENQPQFLNNHPQLKWERYVSIRNAFAHRYDDVKEKMILDYYGSDLPRLYAFCNEYLTKNNPDKSTSSANSSELTTAEKAKARTPGMFGQNKPKQ